MNDTEGEVNLWREAWAGDVWVQSKTIRHQARVARQAFPDGVRGDLTVQAIEELLALSHTAVQRRAFGYRGPVDRWRGVSVQLAYESLHGARIFLVDLLPAKELDAWTPSALAGVGSCLPLGDIRRVRIEALLAEADDESKRAGLKQALDIYYTSSDQGHARLRGFRNMLWAVACLIAAFVAVMVTIVWRSPDAMPVCFTPTVTSAGTVESQVLRRVCPSGEDPETGTSESPAARRPQPQDVAIVAGLGLLGGALAAAFSIRGIRGTSTPYDVPIALAALKVPSGSLTAVVGILLLGGGFVPGLSELDSQRQILAYALVFGYAQQLVTRFIDNRAQTILDNLPSKEPETARPTAPGPEAPQIQTGGTHHPPRRRSRLPRVRQ